MRPYVSKLASFFNNGERMFAKQVSSDRLILSLQFSAEEIK